MLVRFENCGKSNCGHIKGRGGYSYCYHPKLKEVRKIMLPYVGIPSWCPLRSCEFDCQKECKAFGIAVAHGITDFNVEDTTVKEPCGTCGDKGQVLIRREDSEKSDLIDCPDCGGG